MDTGKSEGGKEREGGREAGRGRERGGGREGEYHGLKISS